MSFEEQFISQDKHPSMFSDKMEAIVFYYPSHFFMYFSFLRKQLFHSRLLDEMTITNSARLAS